MTGLDCVCYLAYWSIFSEFRPICRTGHNPCGCWTPNVELTAGRKFTTAALLRETTTLSNNASNFFLEGEKQTGKQFTLRRGEPVNLLPTPRLCHAVDRGTSCYTAFQAPNLPCL